MSQPHRRLASTAQDNEADGAMPLIKVNRINRGGEILINSDHVLYAEVEAKATTIHMTSNLLFSVEESLDALSQKVVVVEAACQTSAPNQGTSTPKGV